MTFKVTHILPNRKSSCGIADYAYNLFHHSNNGLDVEGIEVDDSLNCWLNLFFKLAHSQSIVMQYPAYAYGKSLLPLIFIVFLRFKSIKSLVVLHENHEARFPRRLVNFIVCLFSNRLVLTNWFEFDHLFYKFKHKAEVICIAANTVGESPKLEVKPINNRVAFFGLIRPHKGIEEFIQLIRKDSCQQFSYVFIGTGTDNEYRQTVIETLSEFTNVELHLDLSLDDVHTELVSCTFAFLIYPDGVSERRGSFLAACKAGCLVFSNIGRQTSPSIRKIVHTPDYQNILKIHSCNFLMKSNLINSTIVFSKDFDWNVISYKINEFSRC